MSISDFTPAVMQVRKWLTCSLQRCVCLYGHRVSSIKPDSIWIWEHPWTEFQNRFYTWRKLWLNLAIAQQEHGLPISEEAIEQMKENLVRRPLFNDTAATIACSCVSYTAPHSRAIRDRSPRRKDTSP